MKFGYLILRKVIKFVATRCKILKLKCIKFNFGCAPYSLGELAARWILGAYTSKGGTGKGCRIEGQREGKWDGV